MGYTSAQLLEEAAKWVGYKEKKSNSQLEDYEANAGSGNWNIFAKDLYSAGYYGNRNKNGFSWCNCWVDAMHYYVSGRNKEEAQRVSCQTGIYGAVCTYSAAYYKAQGRFDKKPRPGDQIYFTSSGSSGYAHTGIVESVDDTYVYTIEGNASNMVKRKKYLRDNSSIGGYGHPLYDDCETLPIIETNTGDKTATTTGTGGSITVNTYTLKSGSKGNAVVSMQALLNVKGDAKLELDGSFGPLTEQALMRYQHSHGLDVDGVCGKQSWTELLNGGIK